MKSAIASTLTLLLSLNLSGYTFAQPGPLGGGGIGSRLEGLKERLTNKDSTIHYDPTVLKQGGPRNHVLAAFGEPNATRAEEGETEDVYAFFPDSSKFKDPQMRAGTIAAAVFTGGMSLVARQARLAVQENQLTMYRVHYDAESKIQSVQVVPPNLGSHTPAAPAATPGR